MSMDHSLDVLVLGAGYAGLAAAALLAREGYHCAVLEAHDTIGGCASFYREGKYTFDVGATTFSGVLPHQPAGMVFDTLGIVPELERQDPGMIIRLTSGDVIRDADKDQWIDRAEELFTGRQRAFWQRLYELEDRVWELIANRPYLPPVTARDLAQFLHPRNLSAVPLLPGLLRPMASLMSRYGVDADPRFCALVNELLLISTQNTAQSAPYLPAALGLTYPSETYYPIGGMIRPAILLMRSIQNAGGAVKTRRHVVSIVKAGSSWLITCSNGERYRAPVVVSSIPLWNLGALTEGHVRSWAEAYARKFDTSWSAITWYIRVESDVQCPSAYLQVHLDAPLPWTHSTSLFCTIKPPHDHQKSPAGTCTITMSTHARWADWQSISPEESSRRRSALIEAVRHVIRERIHEIPMASIASIDIGTPYTWQHYTGRFGGYVGGIPHHIRRPLLMLPPNQTPFPGLYHIGDSAFPGQGTPAVMLGAWNTVARIVG
jgi:C-3',4' desaturase CrtD